MIPRSRDESNERPARTSASCSIVKAELLFGAYRSSRQAVNLVLLDKPFQRFESIAFDDVVFCEAPGVITSLEKRLKFTE